MQHLMKQHNLVMTWPKRESVVRLRPGEDDFFGGPQQYARREGGEVRRD